MTGVFIAGLVSAASAAGVDRPHRLNGFRPVQADPMEVEDRILQGANAFRADNRLGPLTENPLLTQEARAFAAFMARTRTFAHTADGRKPTQRAVAAGYRYCVLAENIAFQEDGAHPTAQVMTERFMTGWEHSPEHRRNLLDPDVSETGVGVAAAPDNADRLLAVQVFGLPRSSEIRFSITNRSGLVVSYQFEGKRQKIAPRTTFSYSACRPWTLVFDGRELDRRAVFTPQSGEIYLLEPSARGGVELEVQPGPNQASSRREPQGDGA